MSLFRPTGYHFARKLIHAKTMKDWEMELTNKLLPECAKFGNYTQAYIECHIRHITLPAGAPVGTCKMGAPNDPNAVVDPQLRSVIVLVADILSEQKFLLRVYAGQRSCYQQ